MRKRVDEGQSERKVPEDQDAGNISQWEKWAPKRLVRRSSIVATSYAGKFEPAVGQQMNP